MSWRSITLFFTFILAGAMAMAAPGGEVYLLKKILVADTEDKSTALAEDAGGDAIAFVQDVPILDGKDFPAAIAGYIGKPISIDLLNEVKNTISKYLHDHEPLVLRSVTIPPTQNVRAGNLRFVVKIGRYSQFTFRGNRWFSQRLLEEKLGIKPGDEVRLSTLEDAINWLNTNQFRRVKVLVNELTDQPGKADVVIGVEDSLPLRFAASMDDTGNDVLGNQRYTGSVQFGNLWGLDHSGSYQYSTSNRPDLYQGHAIDYRVPLPWRHFLQFSANYVRSHPSFGNGDLSLKGENLMGSLRYTVPLRGGDNPAEFYTALEFKETNNNLEFGGTLVSAAKVDTFQITTGATAVHRDKHGVWVAGASVNFSPGNVNSRNTDVSFQPDLDPNHYRIGRTGAKARYLTGTLSVQRLQALDKGWEFSSRAVAQLTSTNLIGNEELPIGGANTVRGFNENVFAGDQGFVFSNDLQTPVMKTNLPRFSKTSLPLATRFVFFYDAAQVFFKHPSIYDPVLAPLASTGVGVRMGVLNNFNLSFDYGWQITHLPYPVTEHGRGHVKVVLAF